MIPSKKKINNKSPGVNSTPKKNDSITQISEREKRVLRNVPLHHAQAMREAKRLREQIRVRAVNAEYAHLNQTLGLKKQSKSLPKISKQQTLKTCMGHIKLLKSELSEIMEKTPVESDHLRDAQTFPILHRPLYMPTYPLYTIPSYYPQVSNVALEDDEISDDVILQTSFNLPYGDNDFDTGMRIGQDEDSSISEAQCFSETFDSDLSADFPNYTDSFCSTPESGSSNFSWFISSDWTTLGDN